MTTYAHIENGFVMDVQDNASPEEYRARYHASVSAKWVVVAIPDDVQHGAKANGNGTFTNAPPPIPAVPQPINAGNPYFGKRPLPRKDFFALVGQTLSADRYKRMTSDTHFLWVKDVLDGVDIVDPDDKQGQFLKIVTYLTNTAADDNKPIMETAERDAIMQAWK